MTLPARSRAGGKVILLGEHAVVYGRPALAAGLPLGLAVTLRAGAGPAVEGVPVALAGDPRPVALLSRAAVQFGLDPAGLVLAIESELPPGAGFGSSAALVVATLRAAAAAAGRVLDDATTLALGRELEGIFHGQSSGIDPAAAALGTCFRFTRGEPPRIEPLALAAPLPLVLARGERPRQTGAAVGGLRERWAADRPRHERLFDAVAAVVDAGTAAAVRGDLGALGRAFDENQTLLATLGVSSPEVDTLVARARQLGARGAKLTGGGAGGAIIAVADDPVALAAALAAAGAHTLVARLTPPAAGRAA